MQTYIWMMLLLLSFAAVAVFGIRKREDTDGYFGVDDTTVLKGLWCIIVVLVHIPVAYQNKLQDAVGSFAYIGVTFFFMTSACGLKYGVAHKENYLKGFWKKHLPKLLIPAVLVNILSVLNKVLLGGQAFNVLDLLRINDWVLVLLIFYFVFWLVNRIDFSKVRWGGYLPDGIVCLVVLAYSIICYLFRDGRGWFTECFGFIYGLVFARVKDQYKQSGEKKWTPKFLVSVAIGLVLGVAYLKFKPVEFFGDYLLKILLGIALTNVILLFTVRFKIGNKVSRFLGKISYEVYLLHGVAFAFLTYVAPELKSGVFIVASILLTIAVSAGVQKVSVILNKRIR